MVEQTLMFIKPDAVEKGLSHQILNIFKDNGFHIVRIKQVQLTKDLADAHYQEHTQKPFYPELRQFITKGPIMITLLEKEGAIEDARKLAGATNPAEAQEGTIRKQFGLSITENVIHTSDSKESAQREIELFFPQNKS